MNTNSEGNLLECGQSDYVSIHPGNWKMNFYSKRGGGGGEGIYEDKQMRNALNLTKCQSVMKSVHCAGQKRFG